MAEQLTKTELVELVQKLINADGTEEEIDAWLRLVESSVPDPDVSNIIYWPNVRGLPDDLTAEQIVEMALSYKPILLGPGPASQGEGNSSQHK